eukprot:TRINITY_DN14840_c0_g1_i1.p1 TRINITY_DN14840_c0_g1~~TRINITY_DN14840_c0_g1_i1.p1  ORF type:complete len:1967 (+),score=525.10 TRINITY_DN14840_c0_g1_i1:50-5902(+)
MQGDGETSLSPGEVQEVISGPDEGFSEKTEELLKACMLGGGGGEVGVAQKLLYMQWVLSPVIFSDEVLSERPKQVRFMQEAMKRGLVGMVIGKLNEHLQAMLVNPTAGLAPPEDCIHLVSALVGITQRLQLSSQELRQLLTTLHLSLQSLEGQSMSAVGASWGQPNHGIAGASIPPRLRFPPGSPGAIIEDIAYLTALSIINALRIPLPDSMYLWCRDKNEPNSKWNSLLDDKNLVAELTHLCVRSHNGNNNTYVADKIRNVGQGDRRSRDEAAGYYAMVMIGVSGFLLADANTMAAGAVALRMSCRSIGCVEPGARVIARCNWKGGVFCRGVVRAASESGFRVAFDEGEEETVQRVHVRLETSQELCGRGWMRVREWFPSFFSCGMGTVVSDEVILQCLGTALDCWLAKTMCLIVDELLSLEQEEHRTWDDYIKQPTTTPATDIPPPECHILPDILKAIAFTLTPTDDLDHQSPQEWRMEMINAIIQYSKSEAMVAKPRPGTALFCRFVRKAHGVQGPIAWQVESSHGGQGDIDRTALDLLGSYLDLCRSLCIEDRTCKEVFMMMQADYEIRTTYHISLRFVLTDPDASVVGSLVNSGNPLTPQGEAFLSSAVRLLGVMVSRSAQVRHVISQQPELTATCFSRLFSILEKPVGGVVVGRVFEALAAWIDTHEAAVDIWLKIYRGGVAPHPYRTNGMHDPNMFIPYQGGMQAGMMSYGGQSPMNEMHPQLGGLEYELGQERRQRRYPMTIGFFSLLLKLLVNVNWRVCAQQELQLHELAVEYLKWVLESVLGKWDEQRYDNMKERWIIIVSVLKIIRAGLTIPEYGGVAQVDPAAARQRSPQTALWTAIIHGDLLTRIMSITMERRERDRRTGAIMDVVLCESLGTLYTVLHNSASPVASSMSSSQHGKTAQDVADWDNGGLIMKLSSEEWHSITLPGSFPYQISKYCLLILSELAQAGCRLSHHFIASDRGRPEDITRDAEQSLLITAKATHKQMINYNYQQPAQALDKYVIRPLEAGRRVGGLIPALKRYLIDPMEKVGYAREVAELRNTLQIFEDNKAEMVQEVLAHVLSSTAQDPADNRRLLVCEILHKTLELGTGYYNLAHILCGIPERYVEARARRVPAMPEDKVLRPFGTQRRTCLSVLVERLSEPDSSFVKSDPVAATEFLRVLAFLASDRVVGRAVLRYLRSINLIDKLLGLLKEKLCELPVRPSSVPDPSNLAREFRICASIIQLAALELFTNHDASSQSHILKVLVTTKEAHHPLLLESIRSLDLESLPVPVRMSELLSVPVAVCQFQGIPQYNLETLEDLAQLGAMGVDALEKARHANMVIYAYQDISAYVEAWSRLADVAIVTVGQGEGSDRSTVLEIDEVLFQTLLALVNQLASNISKQKATQQHETLIDAYIAKQQTAIDTRLSRTAITLIDAIHTRQAQGGPTRSPEQLGHLLRPLLQCLCTAENKDLRTNLYIVLTAFLHNVESAEVEITGAAQGLRQHNKARAACKDEFLQNPYALLNRMKADVGCSDSSGALMTAAWTTLATTVEWDDNEQFVAELHGSNLIAFHLTAFDKLMCDVLRAAGHGDTMGGQYLGAYQAYMSFLVTYASTASGCRALVEHHGLLHALKNSSFLTMCGNGFRSTSELLSERCAQIALPALRVVCAVAQHLNTDHSVLQQVHDFIQRQASLFDFVLRRPFHLHQSQDSIDVTSLLLLETATQLLSTFTASGSPVSVREAPRLVDQYQLRSILAEFSSRATWTGRLQDVERYDVQAEGRSRVDVVKEEGSNIVCGVLFNVLSCLRRVCELRSAETEFYPLFELAIHDPEAVSSDTITSRIDITIVLCAIRDLLTTGHYFQKAHSKPTDAYLILTHYSVLEACLLLVYHLKGASEPRFRSQAQQYIAPLLQEVTEYTKSFEVMAGQDPVTTEVMSSINVVAKITADVLGVPTTKRLDY